MIDAVEPAITKLVREAPHRDPATVETLDAALRSVATPLALSIARILGYVAEDAVDPGIALPALAEACATLVAATTADPHRFDHRVLEAARYQIDTLEPLPGARSSLVPLRKR